MNKDQHQLPLDFCPAASCHVATQPGDKTALLPETGNRDNVIQFQACARRREDEELFRAIAIYLEHNDVFKRA